MSSIVILWVGFKLLLKHLGEKPRKLSLKFSLYFSSVAIDISRNHSARHSMVYKRTVACKNPLKKASTVLAKDRISYTSGYVQGSVRSCGTPHLEREEKLL